MTLASGREFLSIPGPTTVPDEVLRAMHRPAIDIYSGALLEVTTSCLEDLRALFRTSGRVYIYAANGHGAWEAALVNVLSKGDPILVLESGLFAVVWGEMARMLGLEVDTLPGSGRRAVDPAALEARLRADRDGHIKAVLVVQVDTASGCVNDIQAIRAAIDAAGHHALLMVDCIASLATMPFDMDGWRVDVAVTGSQKGLMTPPGLSFVAAGPRAVAAHRTAGLRTRYWDWTEREGEQHYQKYCGTPPEHLLFGLRGALDLLREEGLDNVLRRHRLLAEAVRRAVAVWAEGGILDFNITAPPERADSVTTVLMAEGQDPKPLLEFCAQRCGVVLGVGIGPLSGRALRIAHMGHVNAPMILGTLAALEVALVALDIAHGKGGLQAAIDWLGDAIRA
ncbi:MAG: Aminotransferase, class superfamily [Geminicoccaceae bacterium]|jgi:alanine-glyoxylate transaminase/serine-glyoxylate transaminase/serine-pyruvate transaminase|nr:Aminotransferase, class superfamily [Geminicoccaceae bacterium]MCE3248246.1 Aminotransferase, class superfamily [Geminicoccaceae bacterium]MDF2780479.1 Aminotransferase, class superfamily [Geminicoccaceae bacterium]